jgi:D-sedoheptulose 7-phosphate isomerase
MKTETQIKEYLLKLSETVNKISVKDVEQCSKVLLQAYEKKKNIFICGNGGSAATASHFACDINKGVSYGLDKRFKIMALTDNLATISAYSNDVNYDSIFLEQIKNFYNPGDVLIGISGSGNSMNVLKAIEFVNENEGVTIGWTGFQGGKLKEVSQFSINANIDDMQISEDIHMTLVHLMMKVLRKKLTGSEDYI